MPKEHQRPSLLGVHITEQIQLLPYISSTCFLLDQTSSPSSSPTASTQATKSLREDLRQEDLACRFGGQSAAAFESGVGTACANITDAGRDRYPLWPNFRLDCLGRREKCKVTSDFLIFRRLRGRGRPRHTTCATVCHSGALLRRTAEGGCPPFERFTPASAFRLAVPSWPEEVEFWV